MAMTIVETRPIIGGVDTHLDVHVAAALYHHWVLRDATLRRMLPFTRS